MVDENLSCGLAELRYSTLHVFTIGDSTIIPIL
jgi:hypothetical protein